MFPHKPPQADKSRWQEHKSSGSGEDDKTFYFNVETKESVWDKPDAFKTDLEVEKSVDFQNKRKKGVFYSFCETRPSGRSSTRTINANTFTTRQSKRRNGICPTISSSLMVTDDVRHEREGGEKPVSLSEFDQKMYVNILRIFPTDFLQLISKPCGIEPSSEPQQVSVSDESEEASAKEQAEERERYLG